VRALVGGLCGAGWRLFRRKWIAFVALGLLLVPIGIVANLLQY
jgi:hypothetical protein